MYTLYKSIRPAGWTSGLSSLGKSEARSEEDPGFGGGTGENWWRTHCDLAVVNSWCGKLPCGKSYIPMGTHGDMVTHGNPW